MFCVGLPNASQMISVSRRVSEREPDDFCVLVGQRPICHFPSLVRDLGCLVEDQDDSLALVVQASEGFGVVLAPRYGIGPP